MKTILCGQQKGGVGKSTLAGNIAVGLASHGYRVIIIDTDKQQSCVKWASRRKLANHQPEVQFATLLAKKGGNAEFLDTFKALKASNNFDYCIIDAGGRDNPELRLSMVAADVLIAPCLPSQADIESLEEFDAVVGEVLTGNPTLKCMTVLNKVTRGLNFSHEIKLASDAIAEMEHLHDCTEIVGDRPNYRTAWLNGQTVYDLKTDSAAKAILEIEGIIAWLWPTIK
jgi:chromosome partitioning protein